MDSKAELATAIGRHGGEPLNARELFPELRGIGVERGATVKADAGRPEPKLAEVGREPVLSRIPEKYLGLDL